MSTSLFLIASEYRQEVEKLSELDIDAQTLADTLESMSGDLEIKANSVAAFILNMESNANAIREAAAKMADRADRVEKRAKDIREYLLANMRFAGVKKIESPMFTISLRDNPVSVVIDDENQIPAMYWKDPVPPPTPSAKVDKKLIATAIKDGFDVPGAHADRKQRVDIKI